MNEAGRDDKRMSFMNAVDSQNRREFGSRRRLAAHKITQTKAFQNDIVYRA